MGEYEPNHEQEKRKALSAEFGEILNPKSYLERAEKGLQALKELFSSVES